MLGFFFFFIIVTGYLHGVVRVVYKQWGYMETSTRKTDQKKSKTDQNLYVRSLRPKKWEIDRKMVKQQTDQKYMDAA